MNQGRARLGAVLALLTIACSDPSGGLPPGSAGPDATPPSPSPDSGTTGNSLDCSDRLLPGRCGNDHAAGFDAELEALARKYDRNFIAFGSFGFGLNAMTVENSPADRAVMEAFIRDTDDWTFEDYSGISALDSIDEWVKSAGLYAGVAIAADAYRYGVLRDQGYPATEVEQARTQLMTALDALHLAVAITGREGAIARGTLRTDIPSTNYETTPLFDGEGSPLPAEKNNGTWREDTTGNYANFKWEDSCSRDMLLGWATGFAGAWEVIKNDPSFDAATKARLKADARSIASGLMIVRDSGYDLELIDGDGRTTFHGYLNEQNLDGTYIPGGVVKNGAYATMALGILAALTYVSEDAQQLAWIDDTLLAERSLHLVARDDLTVDAGPLTNYSNYNMAFQGAWLSVRYLRNDVARAAMRESLDRKLYDNPSGITPQPVTWGYTLFDFMYAAGTAGATVDSATTGEVDGDAVARGVDSLKQFPEPPYWNNAVNHCDSSEIGLGICLASDGTTIILNPVDDRNGEPQALEPLPFHLRTPSNYQWRSSPLRVNAEGGGNVNFPNPDFRYSYWMGRWVKK